MTGLIDEDLAYIWHPCAQMKDYETFKPLHIVGAKGSYLHLDDGHRIIDAISSWWCKSLGHGHPQLKQALLRQIERFEHVIFANTTNKSVVSLAKQLISLNEGLHKVLFASDGSSVVEMALKMSVHAHRIQGNCQRNHFMSLSNAYHGETLLALSVSNTDIFCRDYEALLLPVHFLKHIPYVHSTEDPMWADCSAIWPDILRQLAPYQDTLSAIIVEPIVQGAAGMRIYSQDFLKRLAHWAKKHGIYLIADEMMTGFGRTGTWFAYKHADITPDFLCLGKGLTAGWLPMSALLLTDTIYQLFYDDYQRGHNFLHSHTHSGNVLAAAVADEVCRIMRDQSIVKSIEGLSATLLKCMRRVEEETSCVMNIRCIGAIAACDLIVTKEQAHRRLGYEVYQKAVKLGALLRPIGNTIYWLPPFTISTDCLNQLCDITIKAIKDVMSQPGY